MNINKDTLENMALILREYGYEVILKESKTKKPYIKNRFNKIRDLDLKSIALATCIFLKKNIVEDFNLHGYDVTSANVTIGYIGRSYYENEDDFDEENSLKTNRDDVTGNPIVEMLSDYDYVIKLSDVFKLMSSNKEFNA